MGVLGLHERADLAAGVEQRAGAQVGEGTHRRAGTDDRVGPVGAHDRGAGAHLHVPQGRVGADRGACGHDRRAQQLRAGQQRDVGSQLDRGVDPRGRGVHHGDALAHPVLDEAVVQDAAELGQLDPVVDALGLPDVLQDVGPDGQLFADGEGHDVGEVQLALGVVVAQGGHRPQQEDGVDREHTAVDLADQAFVVGGVAVLADRLHVTLGVTDDAPVARGVAELRTQDRHGPARSEMGLDELVERGPGEQGDVAVGDDDGARRRGVESLERDLHGVARAPLLGLHDLDDGRVDRRDRRGDLVAAVTDHGDRAGGPERRDRAERVSDERAAGDLVEHLGQVGPHPGASARGEHDRGHRRGSRGRFLEWHAGQSRDVGLRRSPCRPTLAT